VLALADLQAAVRRAVVAGDSSQVAPMLRGGGDPRRRLQVHHRHYATSLTTALLARFPATVWLVGSDVVTAAARAFVEAQPPTRPCIAEYGEDFPAFLGAQPGATNLLYLEPFARLEWHLGRLALAIESPAVTGLPESRPAALDRLWLDVQPSVHYLHLSWPVDALISVFLTGTEPEWFELRPEDVWLEVRGVRGELRLTRLSVADFTFRAAVAQGASLEDAILRGVTRDPAFDVSTALTSLLADRLVTGVRTCQLETHA
jgi:hypothetical protein